VVLAAEVEAEFSFEERAERNLIGGEWLFSREGYGLDIYDPSNSTVIAAVPLSTRRETDRAMEAAQRALPVWGATPRARRLDAVRGAVEYCRERTVEIANLLSRDSGLPVHIAMRDLSDAFSRALRDLDPRKRGHDPATGVIAQVLSWSNPLSVCLDMLAVDLANGNVAIVKPSLRAPLALVMLGEAFQAAGAPGGVFNLLHGGGRDVGAALVRRPELKRVDFQGSLPVGLAVQRVTNQTAVPLRRRLRETLTLNVDGKTDPAIAARAIAEACFCHGARPGAGGIEVRVAAKNVAVLAAAVQREFDCVAYGSDSSSGVRIAPFIEEKFRDRGLALRTDYLAAGAVKLAEAPAPSPRVSRMGWFAAPCLLHDVANAIALDRDAPHGPTAIVRTCEEFELDSRFRPGGERHPTKIAATTKRGG
jgi:acyl-CoA reductase-like NAD-dependent aldehyde dehydrogenase